MRVTGLDGRSYVFSLPVSAISDDKSSLHLKAREIIKDLYPMDFVYEEICLPGSKTGLHDNLFADFVLPRRKLIIEVHGEQHYKFNRFYHGDMAGWKLHKQRDADKLKWCQINNWTYVELKYDATDWRNTIANA